jgi:1-deoxy-D-xylulose-5-phosphate reductoisomerase
MTTVSLVGATGSIGTQAVDVVLTDPERFDVVALGANRSVALLAEQAHRLHPQVVAIGDVSLAPALKDAAPAGTEVIAGPDALAHIAAMADVCVNGVVGFAGLPVTLAALQAGRRLALANKESLIAAGPVVQRVRSTPGAELIPVDSEHCALHQCLRAGRSPHEVRRLLVTASGGPFRGRTRAELADVTVEQALAHPTWAMGPKITVDSSTLMNKGLEVIEALVHRRRRRGPALPARHAPAHRLRAVVPRAAWHRVRGGRLGRAEAARLRAARPGRVRLSGPGL